MSSWSTKIWLIGLPTFSMSIKQCPFFKKKLIYGFLIAAFRKITKHGVTTFKSHPKKSRKDMCSSIKISKDIVLMLMDFYNISVNLCEKIIHKNWLDKSSNKKNLAEKSIYLRRFHWNCPITINTYVLRLKDEKKN